MRKNLKFFLILSHLDRILSHVSMVLFLASLCQATKDIKFARAIGSIRYSEIGSIRHIARRAAYLAINPEKK